ncbi:MarR family transcriptional regulator [Sutcliffiella cohnii]|uniref:MarR family transcriptional regulator n=1 Tax=Sutcliffiella cohnii TaxID=33932 RepID=A0A223KNL7_9BACI|nr:MarR family winged helix-turn-helix transcriptional regulator [Sutcliffiella cohnii]AST91095.1 MarR family transcriptional regulator [Sutcliffiella cohnii]
MNVLYKQNMLLVVRALYFCMERNWAELEREFNLTPAQQHILFLLSSNQYELTPTEISELGCWHISTVTRLLKPLKVNGYVKVVTDKVQRRFKKVTITDKGKTVLIELMDAFKEMEHMPFDMNQISENELDQFIQYGQKLLGSHKGNEFLQKLFNARVENFDYSGT